MPTRTLAGATALIAAPILAIVATLIQPTLSDEASSQVAALTDHRGAMIAAVALSTIALALLVAGVVWLAVALGPQSPRLALAGGGLGVFGTLVVVFENGVAAAAPTIVDGLDPNRATAVLDSVNASPAVSAVEPLSLLGDLGLVALGLAVVRAGAPRWTAAAIAVGALGEGAGFATETRTVVIAGFAILLVGLLKAVRTLVRPRERLAARTVATS
jgi:hypothetical protein